MAEFVQPPFEGDPSAKYADLVAALQAVWPGWQPNEANLDTQLLLAIAVLSASDEETATSALTEIFRWFGLNLVPDGQPEQAVAATGTVTIQPGTGADAQTIPAGTTYGAEIGGEVVGFEVVADQTFASPAVALAGVPVVADRPGTTGNDLTGTLVQVDSLGYVASVTLDAPTAGGTDEEEIATYLDRLRALLQLQAPRPIIPDNFAVMARSIVGVERAVAIDGYDPADHASYDPDDPATWKERYVTVSAIDAAGEDVGATIRTAIDVYFNGDAAAGIRGKRETNFVVAVTTPTYTSIIVAWSAVAWPTWAPADIEAAGNEALAAWLDPSAWGQPSFGEARAWENVREVTADGPYAVLRSVEGLRNVTGLAFGKQIADTFAVDTIGSGLWVLDVGAALTVTGGQLVPTSTAAKSLHRTDISGRDLFAQAAFQLVSTVASGIWGVRVKWVDASNQATVRLIQGTGLVVRTTVAGVTTIKATTAYTPLPNTRYWVRGWNIGNVIRGELYAEAPAAGVVPVAEVEYELTGADATAVGAAVTGSPGIVVTPAHVDERYDDFYGAALGTAAITLDGSPGPVLTRPGLIAGAVE